MILNNLCSKICFSVQVDTWIYNSQKFFTSQCIFQTQAIIYRNSNRYKEAELSLLTEYSFNKRSWFFLKFGIFHFLWLPVQKWEDLKEELIFLFHSFFVFNKLIFLYIFCFLLLAVVIRWQYKRNIQIIM